MAQMLVRNLEDDVRDKLRDLARSHGRSMEEEVRDILRGAVVDKSNSKAKFGSRFSNCFSQVGLTREIQELRGNTISPPDLAG